MLDMTPKEIKERTGIRINPCKACQPVGAMYCALGVHGCMPHSHGSQGCCSYHRTYLSRHFKEPAVASSSSFTEGACVFGGGSNLKTAVKNIFDIYNPDIIAVHTTCLSETIGDDVKAYLQEMEIPEGKYVVHASTPSYVGSHIYGFYNMMSGFINCLSKSTGHSNGRIAVFPGFVNPGDMRELKRIAKLMSLDFTMFPDTSGVMDAPMTGTYEMFPRGGTKVEDIIGLGDCERVFALGEITSGAPAEALEHKCGVPYTLLPYPMGIGATDSFVMALSRFTHEEVPYELEEERGQALDLMLDTHPYYYGKSVAVYGDPDTILGITALTLEMGMIPKYVITGTPREEFVKMAKDLFSRFGVEGCTAKASVRTPSVHQERPRRLADRRFARQVYRPRGGYPDCAGRVPNPRPIRPYLSAACRLPGHHASGRKDRQYTDGPQRPRL